MRERLTPARVLAAFKALDAPPTQGTFVGPDPDGGGWIALCGMEAVWRAEYLKDAKYRRWSLRLECLPLPGDYLGGFIVGWDKIGFLGHLATWPLAFTCTGRGVVDGYRARRAVMRWWADRARVLRVSPERREEVIPVRRAA